jgi:hypothetical protein
MDNVTIIRIVAGILLVIVLLFLSLRRSTMVQLELRVFR